MGIDFRNKSKGKRAILTSEIEATDLVAAGVIDPLLVVKNSFQYGASLASIVLTADCAVLQNAGERHIEHEEFKI